MYILYACSDGGSTHVHAGDNACGRGPEPAHGHPRRCARLQHSCSHLHNNSTECDFYFLNLLLEHYYSLK